ncbi:hypothetical protein LINGRAHAP2_LOCUS30074 [Linum grandiflorum]
MVGLDRLPLGPEMSDLDKADLWQNLILEEQLARTITRGELFLTTHKKTLMMPWGDAIREREVEKGPLYGICQDVLCRVWFEYKHTWSASPTVQVQDPMFRQFATLILKEMERQAGTLSPELQEMGKMLQGSMAGPSNFDMTRPDPGHLKLAKENAQHRVVR